LINITSHKKMTKNKIFESMNQLSEEIITVSKNLDLLSQMQSKQSISDYKVTSVTV